MLRDKLHNAEAFTRVQANRRTVKERAHAIDTMRFGLLARIEGLAARDEYSFLSNHDAPLHTDHRSTDAADGVRCAVGRVGDTHTG